MQKDAQKVKDAINTIVDELNGGNCGVIADVINEALHRQHRTLQQKFWSAILLAQIDYASHDHDLRNEAAVNWAKAVKELAREKNTDMGLPLI